MNRATLLSGAFAFVAFVGAAGALVFRPLPAGRVPQPLPPLPSQDELVLHIRSGHRRLSVQQWPVIQASLLNRSSDPVKLVLPGEGSAEGLRTPVVRWLVRRLGEDDVDSARGPSRTRLPPHCGNVAPLRPEELPPPLAPGEALPLVTPSGASLYFRQPGRYGVRLRYENRPQESWAGWRMLAPADPRDWAALTQTKAVDLVSNELVFEVLGRP